MSGESAADCTPGPWECCPWGQTGFEIQGGGKGLAVVNQVQERRRAQQAELRAQRARRGEPGPDEWAAPDGGRAEALANARLMAAAPDLYAALDRARMLLDAIQDGECAWAPTNPDDEQEVDQVARQIAAALAKAEGREPQP